MTIIRYDGKNAKCELDDDEIEFLAGLYREIKDKKQTFEEYIKDYKKDEIEKFLNSKKRKEG